MSSISLQLEGQALHQAALVAIQEALTPEVKEQMIVKAIEALLKPSTNSWEEGKSPIQIVFHNAAQQVAREEAEKMFREDPQWRERIGALMRTTADRLMGVEQDKFVSNIVMGISTQFR